jgi:ribonucleoside-diphosphate reductase alpha chain
MNKIDKDVYADLLGATSGGPDITPGITIEGGVLEMPLQKVDLHENALRVLEKRYLKKGPDGEPIETVEEMFWRVSVNIAEGDALYNPEADVEATAEEFYKMMASLEFMPNSPTLMNAGRELQQLSACFVLPIEDSMDSIFEAIKNTALIHKSGGGTGFSFSKIRPSGDIVGSTSGISSGPISFMTVFDAATEAIKQGGTRRGANMGILRIDHPDVMDFISCKEDNTKLNNFNISVNITEDFMNAVEQDAEYDLINPKNSAVAGSLRAREVFDKIVDRAWKNGDPGIIFIDRINKENPTPHIGEIESTNPCGEQPLLPYEACNLGSINLNRMIKKTSGKQDKTGKSEKNEAGYEVDWKKLGDMVGKAVHFLDNVIDMNKYPIKPINDMTKSNRKIGLGVMGFADLLIRLGIPYDSEEGVEMGERVMGFIQKAGRTASMDLASERGAFPNYKGSTFEATGEPMRNATVTTIAPTGTISIISNSSSGVEPLFALAYTRTVMEGTELVEVNPLFKEIMRERGYDSPEFMKQVAESGTLHGIDEIPEELKRVFVTSHDIAPEWHIKMQAAFQRHTDNAVSKTVNFSNDATVEDVAKVYIMAYNLGCKGVTVYRDGSRDAQVLTRGKDKEKAAAAAETGIEKPVEAPLAATINIPKVRGEVAFGVTRKVLTGCGNLYVTINEDEEGQPFEIFTQIGKAGGCVASQSEALGRMTSLALRTGVKASEVVKQMRGISCHLPVGYGNVKVTSCADAMAKAMEWYLMYRSNRGSVNRLADTDFSPEGANSDFDMETASGGLRDTFSSRAEHLKPMEYDLSHSSATFQRGACPDCGGTVEHADGCVVCRGCGYTECG